ncbi:MAG TPA: hypothetical protein VMJ34_17900 [Bryobacteraceae bacterium]|nr:hypothetical protein [Bryobacteraceae bacterium]
MFRLIYYLLVVVILISLLRGAVRMVRAMLAAFLSPAQTPPAKPVSASVPLTGELRRDPVCGTYIATTSAITHTAGGETLYFCSPACREKFRAR